jgi:hypothetical protein
VPITDIKFIGAYDRGYNGYGLLLPATYTGNYKDIKLDFTVITVYYNENKIDYLIQVYRKTAGVVIDYFSIPETIEIGNTSDEENIVKMMYPLKDYIHYIIKTRGKIQEKIENIGFALDKADEEIKKCIMYGIISDTLNISADKYLGINPLDLYVDIGNIRSFAGKYIVSAYKNYKEYKIETFTTVDIVEKKEVTDFMYSTNTHIINSESEGGQVAHSNIKILTIPNLYVEIFTLTNLLDKLVTDYHIVDEEFIKQMDAIDKQLYV